MAEPPDDTRMTATPPRTEDRFTIRPPQALGTPKRGLQLTHILTRIVLPLVLFVLLMGVIATLRQVLPSRTQEIRANDVVFADLLDLDARQAKWYDDDPGYFKEYEHHAPGHYDFHFKNVSGKELEFGVKERTCDCSRTKIAFLPENSNSAADEATLVWTAINPGKARPEDAKETEPGVFQLSIPPAARGIIRFSWDSSKPPKKELFKEPRYAARDITFWMQEPTLLVLQTTLWVQPADRSSEKVEEKLVCRMAVTAPLMFMPAKLDLGDIRGPATVSFVAWSVTRSDLKLEEALDPDPNARDVRFVHQIKPLSAEARAKFEKKLKELMRSDKDTYKSYRVKAAFSLEVTIYPEKGGKFLNLGHDRHVPKLLLDGVTPIDGPVIDYCVRGNLQVGEDGRVNVKSFSNRKGTHKVVIITADPKVELKLLANWSPATLKVTLARNAAESTRDQAIWNLEVVVQPYTDLDENAAIFLEVKQNSETRQIRIPVVGNATQG